MTPERSFFSGDVEGIVVGTPDGEIGILAHHEPMLTPLTIGSIRLNVGGTWKEAFLSEGFLEVGHRRTVIFSQACEWPEEIDIRRAEEDRKLFEEKLRQQTSIREYKTNKIAMARAMARLRVTHTQRYNLK
jgi:F-type H+-transporting ATPase subunit epsilon